MEGKDAQLAEPGNEFVIDQETGMLVHDGQQYADTPRIRNLIRRANAIQQQLPAVAQGFTRLWRGNRPGEEGQNPSFTNSLVGIALPFSEGYEGEVTYVDVPEADFRKYLVGGAPDAEFMLPGELARMAKIVKDPLRRPPSASQQPGGGNENPGANSGAPAGWDHV